MAETEPRLRMNIETLRDLARIQCTDEEIAAEFGFTPDVLRKRLAARQCYADAIARGRREGLVALRRMLWQSAADGDAKMVLMLCKNLLGYSDKGEPRTEKPEPGPRPTEELTDDELARIASGSGG